MKKIFYSFLIFFVVLIVAIVFAANSSWVIKKAADKFAPDYKISYDDITGNVFTGVNISDLKFDGKTITKNIKFSWNPSKILYKRVAINEISVNDLDVDVVKALIASFPKSEDDNKSKTAPLPVVIAVDKVYTTINPFELRGVLIEKAVLEMEDLTYTSDDISLEKLFVRVDSNITDLVFFASLNDGKLIIDELGIQNIDSEILEEMFLLETDKAKIHKNKKVRENHKAVVEATEVHPLIIKEVFLKKFMGTLKPRSYKTASIDKLEVTLDGVNADIAKILKNEKNAFMIGNYSLDLQSDIAQVDLVGDLRNSIVTVDDINIKKVDSLLLQTFLVNKDSEAYDMDAKKEASKEVVKEVVKEEVKTGYKNQNNLIPTKVVVKQFHADVLPSIYEPVKIGDLDLDMENVTLDVKELVLENGVIDLNGSSNFSNITYSGKIKDNQILGPIVISPNEELFTFYNLPLSKDAIGDIVVNIDASKEQVVANLKAKARQLLVLGVDENSTDENSTKPFNMDIDELSSKVVYVVKDNTLNANTKIMLSTPYAKDISITNTFVMDKNMSYSGEIKADKVIGIDAKLVKPLNNFNVKYSGDLQSVKTDISSDGLKGSFISSDFKKGNFHLETTEAIRVNQMVALPGELNGTKVNVVIDVPLDFAKITTLKAKAKIRSNISNIDANVTYGETLQATITSNIPKDSLLINFDKNVKWNAISPLVINADLGKKDATLKLKSKELSSDIKYLLDSGKVDGTIRLGGLVTDIKGIAEEKISINAKVNSMESLMNSVKSFYTLEDLPPVEGALNLSVDIMKLKQVNLSLSSPKIIYHADRETEHLINDVKLVVSADKSKVQLKSYNVTYDEMKFFSTKPSVINMKENIIEIAPLWLNDQLQVVGTYDLKTKKGDISADANPLHIAHKMIELDSDINIKTLLNGEKTSIKGKIVLQGGKIKYDLATKTYPSDSDIIIVQDMKKEEGSPFMDNLSMLIDVTTKKPLIYKQGPIDIAATVDLDVHKSEHADLMVLGEASILKGGSYTFEGKRFVLDRSNIYFTGDPNKPLLDISVKYKSLNHLITITISGTPTTPNIIFSSIPSLKREQILSIILFDSEAGAGTNSGDDMMKMMGGAMAKSALSDMGIKLDHLAIGSDGSMEVGKKLTDKIMFIYINDEIPQMKVKYLHTPRLESVISADEESEAYDIVYKRDFSEDDIIMLGR